VLVQPTGEGARDAGRELASGRRARNRLPAADLRNESPLTRMTRPGAFDQRASRLVVIICHLEAP